MDLSVFKSALISPLPAAILFFFVVSAETQSSQQTGKFSEARQETRRNRQPLFQEVGTVTDLDERIRNLPPVVLPQRTELTDDVLRETPILTPAFRSASSLSSQRTRTNNPEPASETRQPRFRSASSQSSMSTGENDPYLSSEDVEPQFKSAASASSKRTRTYDQELSSDAVEPQYRSASSKSSKRARTYDQELSSDAIEPQFRSAASASSKRTRTYDQELSSDAVEPQFRSAASASPKKAKTYDQEPASEAVEPQFRSATSASSKTDKNDQDLSSESVEPQFRSAGQPATGKKLNESAFRSLYEKGMYTLVGSNQDQNRKQPRIGEKRLVRLLTDFLNVPRFYQGVRTNTWSKLLMKEFFKYGLDAFIQDPMESLQWAADSGRMFTYAPIANVVAYLPGKNVGTPEDGIIAITGHYDTHPNRTGLNDNASGIAVMLAIARALTEAECQFDHTVMFVFLDQEEIGLLGSGYFVERFLAPKINSKRGYFQGAFNLDTIMNFNSAPQSQRIPDTMKMYVPELVEKIKKTNFKGDFMLVSGRRGVDDKIGQALVNNWRKLEKPKFKMYYMSATEARTPKDKFEEFFKRGDHWSFWRPDPATYKGTFSAVEVADTVDDRGIMKTCYHQMCDDDMHMMNPKNVYFIKKLGDAMIGSLLDLANGKCAHGLPVTPAKMPPKRFNIAQPMSAKEEGDGGLYTMSASLTDEPPPPPPPPKPKPEPLPEEFALNWDWEMFNLEPTRKVKKTEGMSESLQNALLKSLKFKIRPGWNEEARSLIPEFRSKKKSFEHDHDHSHIENFMNSFHDQNVASMKDMAQKSVSDIMENELKPLFKSAGSGSRFGQKKRVQEQEGFDGLQELNYPLSDTEMANALDRDIINYGFPSNKNRWNLDENGYNSLPLLYENIIENKEMERRRGAELKNRWNGFQNSVQTYSIPRKKLITARKIYDVPKYRQEQHLNHFQESQSTFDNNFYARDYEFSSLRNPTPNSIERTNSHFGESGMREPMIKKQSQKETYPDNILNSISYGNNGYTKDFSNKFSPSFKSRYRYDPIPKFNKHAIKNTMNMWIPSREHALKTLHPQASQTYIENYNPIIHERYSENEIRRKKRQPDLEISGDSSDPIDYEPSTLNNEDILLPYRDWYPAIDSPDLNSPSSMNELPTTENLALLSLSPNDPPYQFDVPADENPSEYVDYNFPDDDDMAIGEAEDYETILNPARDGFINDPEHYTDDEGPEDYPQHVFMPESDFALKEYFPPTQYLEPHFMSTKQGKKKLKKKKPKKGSKKKKLKQKKVGAGKKENKQFIKQLATILSSKLKKKKKAYTTSAGVSTKKHKSKSDKSKLKKTSQTSKKQGVTRLNIETKGNKKFQDIVDALEKNGLVPDGRNKPKNFDIKIKVHSKPDKTGGSQNTYTKSIEQKDDPENGYTIMEKSSTSSSATQGTVNGKTLSAKQVMEKMKDIERDFDFDEDGFDMGLDFAMSDTKKKMGPFIMSVDDDVKRKRKKPSDRFEFFKHPELFKYGGDSEDTMPGWIQKMQKEANKYLKTEKKKPKIGKKWMKKLLGDSEPPGWMKQMTSDADQYLSKAPKWLKKTIQNLKPVKKPIRKKPNLMPKIKHLRPDKLEELRKSLFPEIEDESSWDPDDDKEPESPADLLLQQMKNQFGGKDMDWTENEEDSNWENEDDLLDVMKSFRSKQSRGRGGNNANRLRKTFKDFRRNN